jgi:hypothetical protein
MGLVYPYFLVDQIPGLPPRTAKEALIYSIENSPTALAQSVLL